MDDLEVSFCRTNSNALEGIMQAFKGRKQSIALFSRDPYESHQQPGWHNIPKGVVVSHCNGYLWLSA